MRLIFEFLTLLEALVSDSVVILLSNLVLQERRSRMDRVWSDRAIIVQAPLVNESDSWAYNCAGDEDLFR